MVCLLLISSLCVEILLLFFILYICILFFVFFAFGRLDTLLPPTSGAQLRLCGLLHGKNVVLVSVVCVCVCVCVGHLRNLINFSATSLGQMGVVKRQLCRKARLAYASKIFFKCVLIVAQTTTTTKSQQQWLPAKISLIY